MSIKKDNSTFLLKSRLRRTALKNSVPGCPVLETHGGVGRLYSELYSDGRTGLVIEKKEDKAEILSGQRPHWRVYSADCIKVLGAGLGKDLKFGFIDVDPCGSPFDVLSAIFNHNRELEDDLQLVVNDGLRQKVKIGTAWQVKALAEIVDVRGNDLYPIYLEVALEMVSKIVANAGYRVDSWTGYYCGHKNDMSHYYARLKR